MKRFVSLLLILCFICLCLSGCSPFSSDIADSIKAPQPTGKLYDIREALKSAVGEVDFTNPRSGNYRSAVFTYDITGDGQDEAFALYITETDDKKTVLHLNFLTFDGDKWISVNDIEVDASAVHSVDFADMESAGYKNIIVCSNRYGSKESQVNVFSYNGVRLALTMREAASSYAVVDFDNDGISELMTAKIDLNNKTAVAKLLTLETDGTVVEKSSCKLDGSATEYYTPVFAKTETGLPAVYMDGITPDGLITEVIMCDKSGNIYNPLGDPLMKFENSKTLRFTNAKSYDYDGDGTIEIPTTTILPRTESSTQSDAVYLTTWENFDGYTFSTVAKTCINYTDGYYVEIPDAWISNFTVTRELETKTRVFSEWLSEAATVGAPIITIRVFDVDEWGSRSKNNDYPDFVEITRTTDKVYTYAQGPSFLTVELEEMQERFHLIKN